MQLTQKSVRKIPNIIFRQLQFRQTARPLQTFNVNVHQERTVTFNLEKFQVRQTGKGPSRNVPDFTRLDAKFFEFFKFGEMFRRQLRLENELVGAPGVDGTKLFLFVVDGLA